MARKIKARAELRKVREPFRECLMGTEGKQTKIGIQKIANDLYYRMMTESRDMSIDHKT